MVSYCSVCSSKLIDVQLVPGSHRKNMVCVCSKCGVIQSTPDPDYDGTKDPHSIKYQGKRHISVSEGAMWGNIRHGKGLRLDAHQDLLLNLLKDLEPKTVFDDGANRGHFARLVTQKFEAVKYSGCEPDPICFESYKNNKTPPIKNCYTEAFPIEKNLDFIYSAHTLEHVDSVNTHLKVLINNLKMGGTLLLDLPNSQQINFEKLIFEEYFVEKHRTHFMLNDILSILQLHGMTVNYVNSDPFNMTVVSQKITRNLNKMDALLVSDQAIQSRISEVKDYFKKAKASKNAFRRICKNLNEFKKDNPVIFYGGGRLLLAFLEMGLVKNNIVKVIDNYLYDKIDSCSGLKLSPKSDLSRVNKNIPIILFTRSSTRSISKELQNQNFVNLHLINEFL